MSNNENRISIRTRGQALWLVLSGTVICLAVSLLLNYLLLFFDALGPFARSVVIATVLPILIGTPLLGILAFKLQEVSRYRQELNRAATYDRLTDTLNSTSFSSVVDRRARSKQGPGPRRGVFLIVRVDHLNAINMQYGPSWGDEALRLIARTIRSSVRSGDVVGRVGLGDFGIFLPGATEENGREIAERIGRGVSKVYFLPRGEESALNVGVHGVVFEHELGFEEIHSAAIRYAPERASGEEPGEVTLHHLSGGVA